MYRRTVWSVGVWVRYCVFFIAFLKFIKHAHSRQEAAPEPEEDCSHDPAQYSDSDAGGSDEDHLWTALDLEALPKFAGSGGTWRPDVTVPSPVL